jgi:hypothetical protein
LARSSKVRSAHWPVNNVTGRPIFHTPFMINELNY